MIVIVFSEIMIVLQNMSHLFLFTFSLPQKCNKKGASKSITGRFREAAMFNICTTLTSALVILLLGVISLLKINSFQFEGCHSLNAVDITATMVFFPFYFYIHTYCHTNDTCANITEVLFFKMV